MDRVFQVCEEGVLVTALRLTKASSMLRVCVRAGTTQEQRETSLGVVVKG